MDVGLLSLLVGLCPSLCLFSSVLAYFFQQIQKSPKIIVGLSGRGAIPDPFSETRGQLCVPSISVVMD